MSTLSSSSTLTDARNAYKDNLSYYEDGSVTKAKAFISACVFLIGELPRQSQDPGGGGITLSIPQLQREKERAEEWLAANQTDPHRQFSFRDYR